MARRPDDKPRPRRDRDQASGSARGGRGGGLSRTVTISKALSKLLRHQAQNEKVPISAEGWCRVSDVLAWRGLSGATLEEVAGVVVENDKKRFAVRWVGDSSGEGGKGEEEGDKEVSVEGLMIEQSTVTATTETQTQTQGQEAAAESSLAADEEGSGEGSATDRAVKAITSATDTDPAHYFIRAVQGHSMRSIGTDDLLTPITLSNMSSITSDGLVVHGTFYGAWRAILATGGLKRMSRNHVHFATGPALREALPDKSADGRSEEVEQVVQKLEQNKVISGMRRDAQILIYVDVKRALEEGVGMEWWRSENGVVLTEGVCQGQAGQDVMGDAGNQEDVAGDAPTGGETAGRSAENSKAKGKVKGVFEKIVPMSCWEVVVEVKQGHGVIWRKGEGVVKELPDALLDRGMPQGKGRGGGRGGRGR